MFAMQSLDVNINNIKKDGLIRIYIYNSARFFASKKGTVFRAQQLVKNQDTVSIHCDYIDAKRIAVMVFQDLNNNRQLDTNWLNQPIEPYGFSNNVTSVTGAPSFEKASFLLKPCKSIEIQLINP